MARIRSVGGIATVQGRLPDQIEPVPGAADGIQINVRLFAKTAAGLLAIDPRPQRPVFGLEAMLPQGVAHDQQRLVQGQRLFDEVEGPHLDRLHR